MKQQLQLEVSAACMGTKQQQLVLKIDVSIAACE
jgi:hypothetical protein